MPHAVRLPVLALFLATTLLMTLFATATPAAADRCNPGEVQGVSPFGEEEDSPLCPLVDYEPVNPPADCGDNPCTPYYEPIVQSPQPAVAESVRRTRVFIDNLLP